jgi:hypothetical protein
VTGRGFAVSALAIYAIARGVGWNLLFLAASQLRSTRIAIRRPFRDWHEMIDRWDVFFYRTIAHSGYPSTLPIDQHGDVMGNPWAFFPAFPYLTRAVEAVTGLDFETAAVLLNIVAGAVAAVCIGRLARTVAGDSAALRTVALWAFFPTAVVLQLPYSEALFVMFVAGCLVALLGRRFWLASALLAFASFSRAFVIGLSGAAVCALATEIGAMTAGSRRTIRSVLEALLRRRDLVVLGLTAVIAPVAWMIVAAVVTGRADAYLATQRAWGYSPSFTLLRDRWAETLPGLGVNVVAMVAVLVLAAASALAVAAVRLNLPLSIKVYTWLGVAMLLATGLPGSVAFGSLSRLAFGVVTLPLILAMLVGHRVVFAAVVGVFIGLQYLWVFFLWSGRHGVAP